MEIEKKEEMIVSFWNIQKNSLRHEDRIIESINSYKKNLSSILNIKTQEHQTYENIYFYHVLIEIPKNYNHEELKKTVANDFSKILKKYNLGTEITIKKCELPGANNESILVITNDTATNIEMVGMKDNLVKIKFEDEKYKSKFKNEITGMGTNLHILNEVKNGVKKVPGENEYTEPLMAVQMEVINKCLDNKKKNKEEIEDYINDILEDENQLKELIEIYVENAAYKLRPLVKIKTGYDCNMLTGHFPGPDYGNQTFNGGNTKEELLRLCISKENNLSCIFGDFNYNQKIDLQNDDYKECEIVQAGGGKWDRAFYNKRKVKFSDIGQYSKLDGKRNAKDEISDHNGYIMWLSLKNV